MNSIGLGDRDDRRCPQCRQFVANAELIVPKMETIERKMNELQSVLLKYEWVVIENSIGIKNMRKNGMEINAESFDVAFKQSKRFLRLLEIIESDLNKLGHYFNDIDSDSFDDQTTDTV